MIVPIVPHVHDSRKDMLQHDNDNALFTFLWMDADPKTTLCSLRVESVSLCSVLFVYKSMSLASLDVTKRCS